MTNVESSVVSTEKRDWKKLAIRIGRSLVALGIVIAATLAWNKYENEWWWARPHVVAVVAITTVIALAWVLRGAVGMHEVVDAVVALASAWATWRVFLLAASRTEDDWKGLAWPLAVATVCTGYATIHSAARTVTGYLARTTRDVPAQPSPAPPIPATSPAESLLSAAPISTSLPDAKKDL
jgi:hypothetical protein